MLKKIMLLASMTVAVIAFAAPAAAQAEGPDVEGTETFEGALEFTVQPGFPGAGSSFGCVVTTHIGESLGLTTANVTMFEPKTSSCAGTGAFAGCALTEHLSNGPWTAHTDTEHRLAIWGGLTVTIRNRYWAGSCAGGQTETHLNFTQLTAVPSPTEGGIKALTITATSTNGAVKVSGTLLAEAFEQLFMFTTEL